MNHTEYRAKWADLAVKHLINIIEDVKMSDERAKREPRGFREMSEHIRTDLRDKFSAFIRQTEWISFNCIEFGEREMDRLYRRPKWIRRGEEMQRSFEETFEQIVDEALAIEFEELVEDVTAICEEYVTGRSILDRSEEEMLADKLHTDNMVNG